MRPAAPETLLHLKFVLDPLHAFDLAGDFSRLGALRTAFHRAFERHDAAIRGHADVGNLERRLVVDRLLHSRSDHRVVEIVVAAAVAGAAGQAEYRCSDERRGPAIEFVHCCASVSTQVSAVDQRRPRGRKEECPGLPFLAREEFPYASIELPPIEAQSCGAGGSAGSEAAEGAVSSSTRSTALRKVAVGGTSLPAIHFSSSPSGTRSWRASFFWPPASCAAFWNVLL